MASATLPFVSLDHYLRCSDYEPDADYVDDHVEERPMGELDHSDLQTEIAAILRRPQNRAYFRAYAELRVQVAPRRVRVPDVCLIACGGPKEQVVQTPPLLCIEVLSPEDRLNRVMVRVRDFLDMGVAEVWVFDPKLRSVQVCSEAATTIHTAGDMPIPGTPLALSLAEVFQALDE